MVDAARIMARCEALARHSELAGGLTRVFLSTQSHAAAGEVLGWMEAAGMRARLDAIGNVHGRYESASPGAPCLVLGSHLDTVRDAGRYDGILGVVSAIECVHSLSARGVRLPFAVEVIGFGDEEGVRFGTTLLGSRALAGLLEPAVLETRDASGVSIAEGLRAWRLDPRDVPSVKKEKGSALAYVELHIEQGPVLEAEGLPLGVVTAINGFSRLRATLTGTAGHAGTVPMRLRRDALAAAAECVLAVERVAKSDPELVGTVGRIEAHPGAINVIPGSVVFTIDFRAPRDELREDAVRKVTGEIEALCSRRNVEATVQPLQSMGVTRCAEWLMGQLDAAVAAQGVPVRRLPSGAGHDGMALQALCDIGMLFVRCRGGVSHNPAEAISEADAGAGARALLHFIEHFVPRGGA
ncbi:MAG TPA: allantoate amidohydrolase [Burkholderiales bacterium]|nr:allantoate amidohydrolase [Burkholderiales bacterium]